MFFLFLVFCLAFSPETKNDINTGRWLTKNDIKMRRCNYIFLCFFCDRFTIDLRSICDRFASNKFEINKFSLYTCARHMCFQISWRFDVDSMGFSERFWRCSFYSLTDAGSMEVPWRFHGDSMEFWCRLHPCPGMFAGSMEVPWRFDVDYMDFPGMFWRSCHFPSSGSVVLIMQVWWRFHGVSMEVWCRLHGFFRNVLKVFPVPL